MTPGTLNLADRNVFSVHSWSTAAGTGANLMWRVKNSAKSLPAKVVSTLTHGSHLVRLHESDALLSARHNPRRAGCGLLHATPAGRTGVQDPQVHSARVRPATARQTPDLAEQEIWGFPTVYNALVDQAITAAVNLDVDLRRPPSPSSCNPRNHLVRPCQERGHPANGQSLAAAIVTGPRNRADRDRTSPAPLGND
jgi:hypothetical protein